MKPYEYLFFRIGNVDIDALGGGVFAQDYRENNKKNDQVQQPGAKSVLNLKGYEYEKYCEKTSCVIQIVLAAVEEFFRGFVCGF